MKIKNKDKLLITPHIAWASTEARYRLINEVAENIRAFLNGIQKQSIRKISQAKRSRRARSAKPTKYNTRECAFCEGLFVIGNSEISYVIKRSADTNIGQAGFLFISYCTVLPIE